MDIARADPRLPDPTDRFTPAEMLLDALANDLADPVAGMPGRATIDRAPAVALIVARTLATRRRPASLRQVPCGDVMRFILGPVSANEGDDSSDSYPPPLTGTAIRVV
jgi:hypothetical protein